MKSIIASMAVAAGLMVVGSAMAVDMPAEGKAKCGAFGWKFGSMPPKGMGATDAEIKSLAHFIVGLK